MVDDKINHITAGFMLITWVYQTKSKPIISKDNI